MNGTLVSHQLPTPPRALPTLSVREADGGIDNVGNARGGVGQLVADQRAVHRTSFAVDCMLVQNATSCPRRRGRCPRCRSASTSIPPSASRTDNVGNARGGVGSWWLTSVPFTANDVR